jgi:hypothetical protein
MRKLAFAAAALGVFSLVSFAASAAQAAVPASTHPTATFTFKHSKVDRNVKPVLTYSTSHLPTRSVIYLQRQFGTAHVWENVEKLKAAKGTTTAPGVPMGKYGYRIRVLHKGKAIAYSHIRYLYSYAKVQISALCADYYGGSCGSQTVQIGQTIFTYVMDNCCSTYPSYQTDLQFNTTSCDALTVTFATQDTSSGARAYVEVIQSRSDPQYGSTPIATIGTFHAKLDGGPFYLESSETNGDDVYENGSASCYTPSGQP